MGLLYKSDLSVVAGGTTPKRRSVLGEKEEKEITAHIARFPKLSGFVFDIPSAATKEEAEILSRMIKSAVASIGIGVNLHSKRTLVLIPATIDRELVSHRIRANFQIKNSYTFSMTNTDDIRTIIKNY
jgi:hypothetical protein